MFKARAAFTTLVAVTSVLALTGSAQADPGRPNNPINGTLPAVGKDIVQYSTYRTVSAWEEVDFRYEDLISHYLRMGLRDTSGWQFTPTKVMGTRNSTYTIATNGPVSLPRGKRFAINARSNGWMLVSQDNWWGGQLYW
ncbi:hypothetical protein LKM28_27385 [Streptomyces sp. CT1-17]|uniref:Uncharacterized protein n=1 Tax=Streptomyces thinghirensis TaxID=551547 RepID=A0ABP9T041_9ACTN|nr:MULTISPECIES: hypothetical protein [unclassified Streptomyces]MCC2270006.1 hypothetical protein [Streptomyces sp. CT1-17]QIP73591.1 hypothetical protein EZV63_30280 [Streptomyces sp. VN1]